MTKLTSPTITHKGDACQQNESTIRTYKGDTAYKPRLLYLKHETGNDKVRRRDISGSPMSSILGDADSNTRLQYELLVATRVVVPRL